MVRDGVVNCVFGLFFFFIKEKKVYVRFFLECVVKEERIFS